MWHELWERLRLTQGLWQASLLQSYPQSFAEYQEGWLDELAALDEQALFHFDEAGSLARLDCLRTLLLPFQKIQEQIPKYQSDWKFSSQETPGISEKKLHEMSAIIPLLQSKANIPPVPWIDWGGGMGHLASRMHHHLNLQVYSCDRNPKLQDEGKQRYDDQVQFITTDLLQTDAWTEPLSSLLEANHASIALHACGPLSLHQMRAAMEHPCQFLLNLACCYHFLRPEETMISQEASQYGFRLSSSALDLAARTRKKKRLEHFILKRRVNAYRWAVHFFLTEELGDQNFQVLGSAPDRLYLGNFADYAAFAAGKIGLDASKVKELNQYFQNQDLQKRLNQVFFVHLIRWQFARPLEIAIIADRSQWLNEQGFASQVLEIFDAQLSPRNLAILAKRQS